MTESRPDAANPATPWWRHGMVWLLIALPAAAVLGSFASLGFALAHPDPVLATSEVPAIQARNHAAAPMPSPTRPSSQP